MRSRVASRLGTLLLLGALLPFTPLTPAAHATDPACNPTYAQNTQASYLRTYVFSTTGTCIWTVPTGIQVYELAIVSGGGGGGGGSYAYGAGGGGGGGGVYFTRDYTFLEPGTQITIKVGAGGAGGSGGMTSGSSGSDGDIGGNSAFGKYEIVGGSGGGGGSINEAGNGGGSGYRLGRNSERRSGGSAGWGNGGGGAIGSNYGDAATTVRPGAIREGESLDPYRYQVSNITLLGSGGSGGASGNYSAVGGGTATSTASTPSRAGNGGHGGHGCLQSDSSCSNQNGSAGSDGIVMLSINKMLIDGQTAAPDDSLGGDLRPYVGTAYRFKPFYAPEPIGSGSWSVSPALPNGFTLNSSTGEVSGTPTQLTFRAVYTFTFTDTTGSISAMRGIVVRTGRQSMALPPQTLAYKSTYRIPIEQLRGSGALSILSSNTGLCRLSGSNNETVTAQQGSGTCTIRVIKAATMDWTAFDSTFVITLARATPTVTLTTNIASPQATGTTVTLSASISGTSTGQISFYAGDNIITNCGVSGIVSIASSAATCDWTPVSASGSPFPLTARYISSSYYEGAISNTINYTINPAISLEYSGSESTFGTGASITPFVSGGTGDSSTWTWSIVRNSDNSAVSGISIDSSGTVSISGSLAAGTYAMRVTVIDTANTSQNVIVNISVASATPIVRLERPAKNAYTKGQQVSLTAVLPSNASGTISFTYGGGITIACAEGSAVTISGGAAVCTWSTSALTPGEYSVMAEYSGGGSYTAATSFAYSLQINAKAVITYENRSETFGNAWTSAPQISAGTGDPTDWTWNVVKRSDSSTVTGISISSSGLIQVGDSTGAGLYQLAVTAIDMAGETSTVLTQIVINKAQPVISLTPRLITNDVVSEATVNRQIQWVVTSTHRSSGTLTIYVNNSAATCFGLSIQFGNGQCWWQSSTSGITVSAYATFAGDANLETATSNMVSNFAINPALYLSYSDTSTYAGTPTAIIPSWGGGTGTKTFSLAEYFTNNQIQGITIDTSTGVISIDRSAVVGSYRMVVSLYDITSANAIDDNLQIDILAHVAPNISLTSSSESKELNQSLVGFSVINTSTPALYYEITPTLPTGVVFDTLRGTLSGSSSSPLTNRVFTIKALNSAGSDTATFTLTFTEPTSASITISLGTSPVAKGVVNSLVATISAAGKVEFFLDNRRIPGCIALRGTSSVTCSWKPTRIGSFNVKARLVPTNGSIAATNSNLLNVSVSRRTGTRG